MSNMFLTSTGLTRLVRLIKDHFNQFTKASFNATDQVLTLTAGGNSTNISLQTTSSYMVGDIVYKMHSEPLLDDGMWAICRGQQLLEAEYPDLHDLLGNTYSTSDDYDSGYFRVPNIPESAVLGHANTSTNYNHSTGANEKYITQDQLPNDLYYTVNNNSSYDGRHNHLLRIRRTSKSGKDTATVLSYSESRFGDKYVYNDVDNHGGAHQHIFRLNPYTHSPVNVKQPTKGFGNYYIYTGGRHV